MVADLIAGGIAAAVLTAMLALVRIAVTTERGRANDWRDIAKTSNEANAVLSANVEKLITSIEQLATTQREMMSLLQTVASDRRGAA